jgi:hypothetical protein
MLKSIMHVVINRGILVTAAQILQLIFFFATSGHLYWCIKLFNGIDLFVLTHINAGSPSTSTLPSSMSTPSVRVPFARHMYPN